jgi:hypothetical protein
MEAGGVVQVIECLPSKHEFKPQYCQKKKKKVEMEVGGRTTKVTRHCAL